jgi:diguanylate cyclase (GGDEF)-like protein
MSPSDTQSPLLQDGAMRAVWERHRGRIVANMGEIERAVAAVGTARFDEQLRGEARRCAHMLSGSLGMFGFTRASEAAHELEQELAQTSPARATTLATLLSIIRRGLDWEQLAERAVGGLPSTLAGPAHAPARTAMLIVDRDPDRRAAIAAASASRGTPCETVASARQARTLCAQRPPALVLLDLSERREEMDESFALLSDLSSATPPIPVLLLTDSPAFADRLQAVRGGSCAVLPRSLMPDELLSAVEQFRARRRLAATRVLLVDDDPTVHELLRSLLLPHDLEVFTLAEPLRFWETLEEVAPELLILDVDMPEVNGPELCRTVRNDPRWSRLPVVFLAARSDADTVEEVFNAGADDYVAKATLGSEFVARISNRLERVRLFRALAENDGLTGLSNRATTEQGLKQLAELSDRFSEPLSVVMLDVDRFKLVNDTHGHAAGDSVLRRLAACLRGEFRDNDVVGRWGGEEFLIGMYGMTRANAVRRLSEIERRFRQEEFEGAGETIFHVGFSAGVAEYPLDGADTAEVCRAADEALYRAKAAGRGRVEAAAPTVQAALGRADAAESSADPLPFSRPLAVSPRP